ncbi:MAG: hypothetical protein ACXAB5_05905 [Candidatus Thorarchaeota archaeon]
MDALEKDDVISKAVGPEILRNYIKLKKQEWRQYTSHIVTDWEWEMYEYN